ncbi:hypothetical protein CYMTET_17108 [Cymbomonas tetramitiformis]|uniref:PCI domain-containing protein n=1 Tax=Cymbomonas tetramitiformis TaxID=36881 RepID=A0AAE0GB66_9CHLO|nr:hypothetical protein CYMTET_17108 [Cymbomonas tetramitiformis]
MMEEQLQLPTPAGQPPPPTTAYPGYDYSAYNYGGYAGSGYYNYAGYQAPNTGYNHNNQSYNAYNAYAQQAQQQHQAAPTQPFVQTSAGQPPAPTGQPPPPAGQPPPPPSEEHPAGVECAPGVAPKTSEQPVTTPGAEQAAATSTPSYNTAGSYNYAQYGNYGNPASSGTAASNNNPQTPYGTGYPGYGAYNTTYQQYPYSTYSAYDTTQQQQHHQAWQAYYADMASRSTAQDSGMYAAGSAPATTSYNFPSSASSAAPISSIPAQSAPSQGYSAVPPPPSLNPSHKAGGLTGRGMLKPGGTLALGANFKFAASKSQRAQNENSAGNVSNTPGLPTPAYVKAAPKSAGASADKKQGGQEQGGSKAWPPSLRAFVERAFQSCKGDVDRAALQINLKHIITEASTKAELWTRDWDTMPMPLSRRPDEDGEQPERKARSRSSSSRSRSPSSSPSSSERGWGRDSKPRFDRQLSTDSWKSNDSWKAKQKGKKNKKKNKLVLDDQESSPVLGEYERQKRQRRAGRFGDDSLKSPVLKTPVVRKPVRGMLTAQNAGLVSLGDKTVDEFNPDAAIKGTCEDLEKSYFRLTSAPDPSTVRPQPVLEAALERLYSLERNYWYDSDQLKGIRQDLTVQHIYNEFTVKVYEYHARLALEAKEVGEFNGIQTRLIELYAEGLKGHEMEFLAYLIINSTVTGKTALEMLPVLKRITKDAIGDPAVKHAMAVRKAVLVNDWVAYFRLYQSAPNNNARFLELYMDKLRFKAITVCVRVLRTVVPVRDLIKTLGFDVVPEVTAEEEVIPPHDACTAWLAAHGAVLQGTGADTVVDCKSSVNTLFVPTNTAVAHGDANLTAADFLSSSFG